MTVLNPGADQQTNTGKYKEKLTGTDIGVHVLLIGLGLIISLPIFIAFFTSFKIPSQVTTFPPTLIPREWTVANYVMAWESTPFGRFLLNSLVQSGLITLGQVIFSILAAYAFSILVFPGRNALFYLVLGSLMVPFELTFIPNFIIVSEWGLADSYQGLIVPFIASAFGVFMLRQ